MKQKCLFWQVTHEAEYTSTYLCVAESGVVFGFRQVAHEAEYNDPHRQGSQLVALILQGQ